MKILFLGDIVGTPGIDLVRRGVPVLRQKEGLDLVIANAENASAGSGMTPRTYKHIRAAGVDLVTMGDHIYKKAELIPTLQADEFICKPANFPAQAPGKEWVRHLTATGIPVAAFSLLGRTFMRPVDCPFQAADRVLTQIPAEIRLIFVDIHAEATADKYLLAHHLKGRVTAVLGTHTHVPTADEQVLEGGTAFQCDVGMCGPYESILGRKVDRVLSATVSFVPVNFDVASGDARLAGAIIEADAETGKARSIRRVMWDDQALTDVSL
jgi:metallophosphoesterase (TIGR00282 family)